MHRKLCNISNLAWQLQKYIMQKVLIIFSFAPPTTIGYPGRGRDLDSRKQRRWQRKHGVPIGKPVFFFLIFLFFYLT